VPLNTFSNTFCRCHLVTKLSEELNAVLA